MAENEATATRVAVLTLEFSPLTFELKIGGAIPNLNCALSMLDQARRELERRANILASGHAITHPGIEFVDMMRKRFS